MNKDYHVAIFELSSNPLWGAEHFPQQYLHSSGQLIFDDTISAVQSANQLLCCCAASVYALGLFYADHSLVVDYAQAKQIRLEQLRPGKGAGAIFITIQFPVENNAPPALLLTGAYHASNITLFAEISRTIGGFTKLPVVEADLGFDV